MMSTMADRRVGTSVQRTPYHGSTLLGFLKLLAIFLSTSIRRGFVQGFVYSTKSAHNTIVASRHGSLRARQRSPDFLLHQSQQRDPDATSRVNLPKAETYESTDFASKGLVSVLTSLINNVMDRTTVQRPTDRSNFPPTQQPSRTGRSGANDFTAGDGTKGSVRTSRGPPRTPEELLDRIRDDYTVHNYLWTGNLDVTCFDPDCAFQDPTISFRGTDQYVRNVQNLRPVVDAVVTSCRSDVLDILLNPTDGYVQTRWNMVGDLHRLPWRPRIDVVGRTKFWYRSVPRQPSKDIADGVDEEKVVVVRYDEEWEIPAYRALLQLVTSGGP